MEKLFYTMCYIMAFFSSVGLFFSSDGWRTEIKKSFELTLHGLPVTGTIIRIEAERHDTFMNHLSSGGYVNSQTPVVSYEVDGKTYEAKLNNNSWDDGQKELYQENQQLPLLYSAKHPEVACSHDWLGMWRGTLEQSITILTGLAFVVTLWLIPQSAVFIFHHPLFTFPLIAFFSFMGSGLLYKGLTVILTSAQSPSRILALFMIVLGSTLLFLTRVIWRIFEK